MSTAADPRPAYVVGPRHAVGGAWRRRLELSIVGAVVAPFALVLVALVATAFLNPLLFVGLVLIVTALSILGRNGIRWAYWRSLWWHDARAFGLTVNAERSIFGRDTGAVDVDHLVVAPFLRRLEVGPNGRAYTVRCLPGQTPGEYAAASGMMAARWNATAVRVEHVPGDRYVRIVVELGRPAPMAWRARR